MNTRTRLLCVALASAMGCSSGTNPSFSAASNQFYEAYCARLLACHQESKGTDVGKQDFLRSYPGGEPDCVEQNVNEFSSLEKLESKCSQEQWDKCAADFKTTTCVNPDTTGSDAGVRYVGPVIPASCDGC